MVPFRAPVHLPLVRALSSIGALKGAGSPQWGPTCPFRDQSAIMPPSPLCISSLPDATSPLSISGTICGREVSQGLRRLKWGANSVSWVRIWRTWNTTLSDTIDAWNDGYGYVTDHARVGFMLVKSSHTGKLQGTRPMHEMAWLPYSIETNQSYSAPASPGPHSLLTCPTIWQRGALQTKACSTIPKVYFTVFVSLSLHASGARLCSSLAFSTSWGSPCVRFAQPVDRQVASRGTVESSALSFLFVQKSDPEWGQAIMTKVTVGDSESAGLSEGS